MNVNGATGVLLEKSSLPGNAGEGGDFIETLTAGGATSVESQLPGIADNCLAIVRLLGDMSPSYDAAAWNRLAKCYRDTLPGVALYAWLQAEQRQSGRLATSCGSLSGVSG